MVSIDRILEEFDPNQLEELKHASKILLSVGLFDFLVEENKRVLLSKFDNNSAEELAKEITEVKQTNRVYLSLAELAGQLKGIVSDA